MRVEEQVVDDREQHDRHGAREEQAGIGERTHERTVATGGGIGSPSPKHECERRKQIQSVRLILRADGQGRRDTEGTRSDVRHESWRRT